jgi:acyl carrier protein
VDDTYAKLLADSGVGLLSDHDVFELVDYTVASRVADVFGGLVDLSRYAAFCQALAPRGLLTGLTGQSDEDAAEGMRTELAGLSGVVLAERVMNHVAHHVGEVLGMGGEEAPLDRGFFNLGMDSVLALALKARLERNFGLRLPNTLTFEFPTTEALAKHIVTRLEGESDLAVGPGAGHDSAQPYSSGSAGDRARAPLDEGGLGTAAGSESDKELLRRLEEAVNSAELALEATRYPR